MYLRTIMIFPNFENMNVIDHIRDRYDPLARLVRPHITIVFPFNIEMSDNDLSNMLDKRLNGIKPFYIELQGFSKSEDRVGNYLFLDVIKGADNITMIHDALYRNEFKSFDLGLQYVPHITVGKVLNTDELNNAYEELQNDDTKFCSLVDKISVEMIGEHDESIIIIEKKLQ